MCISMKIYITIFFFFKQDINCYVTDSNGFIIISEDKSDVRALVGVKQHFMSGISMIKSICKAICHLSNGK